ncbi:uncharacterized protein LOC132751119 [Ruditapes philippinarum]|uniref:uncharacterized protein LOC132751119 n=1 Tax=Ruditapes philippinarum TaxID=129788 RepID=UPI00295B4DE8|nr:uncharacterized protein LOC132751119 [Ruditapes philippinarum]
MAGRDVVENINDTDIPPGKEEQRRRPWYKRNKKAKVFIYLHSDDLKRFKNRLKKRIKVKREDNRSNNGSPKSKKRTIIVVRHASSRIDSDVKGCCKDIQESDIKRTIVVIVFGFKSNQNDCHGMEIRPKTLNPEDEEDKKLENLKGIVEINYKCSKWRTNCKDCKNALKILKMQVKSPNDY